MIEQITSDEQRIHFCSHGACDDCLEAVIIEGTVCLALFRFAVAVAIQMYVGCMQDFQGASALMFHAVSLSDEPNWDDMQT
jgi:hypothetical protein